jgi:hypothetical protein
MPNPFADNKIAYVMSDGIVGRPRGSQYGGADLAKSAAMFTVWKGVYTAAALAARQAARAPTVAAQQMAEMAEILPELAEPLLLEALVL